MNGSNLDHERSEVKVSESRNAIPRQHQGQSIWWPARDVDGSSINLTETVSLGMDYPEAE